MPYCTHCGHQESDGDRFCRRCGTPHPSSGPPAAGLSSRGSSILCYVPWLGWIASVYVLANERFRLDRDARFHAYQGLYLFVAWMIVHWAVGLWIRLIVGKGFPLHNLLELIVLVAWIFMLVKTSSGRRYSLPVIGELAERSL